MLQAEEFPAGVTNLDSALGCVASVASYMTAREKRGPELSPPLWQTLFGHAYRCLEKKGKSWSKALMNKSVDSALGKNEQNPQRYANDLVTVNQMESDKSPPNPTQKNCRWKFISDINLEHHTLQCSCESQAINNWKGYTVQNVWLYALPRRKIKNDNWRYPRILANVDADGFTHCESCEFARCQKTLPCDVAEP